MPVEVQVSIWLASPTRRVHLQKLLQLQALPRVGEFLKLRNGKIGDYFPWRVTDITHREGGTIQLSTELLNDDDGRGYSFASEAEFDEYYESYLREGWTSQRGVGRNTRLLGRE